MAGVKRTERGWAGHFIGARNCLFRRNTLLECGERRVVVSTVGDWRTGPPRDKAEEIGLDRYYETMAFEAEKAGVYWDADVTRQISFESPWSIDNVDDTTDREANDMHEAVVAELTKRLAWEDM